MKVAIVQNLANSMLPRIEPLRNLGVKAELFVGYNRRNPDGSPLPNRSEDPQFLTGRMPEWAHYLDFSYKVRPFFYNLNQLSGYDIIHSCCMAPIVNQFFLGNNKFICLANGSDLRYFSRERGIRQALLRKAYRRADRLIYVNLDKPTIEAIKAHKLENKASFLEYLIEFPETDLPDGEKPFTVFYPSELRDNVKGTSIFIKAFKNFIAEKPGSRLVMIDSGQDNAKIRDMLEAYGLENSVQWNKYCNLEEIARLYLNSDVVAGVFWNSRTGVPHYPKVLLEGLYFGKPIISCFDREIISDHYQDFPALFADDEKAIFNHLINLHEDRQYHRACSERSLKWFKLNCSKEIVTKNLINIYNNI